MPEQIVEPLPTSRLQILPVGILRITVVITGAAQEFEHKCTNRSRIAPTAIRECFDFSSFRITWKRRSRPISSKAFAGYFEKYDVLRAWSIPFTAPLPGLEEYVVNGEKVAVDAYDARHGALRPRGTAGSLSAVQLQLRATLPINVQIASRWFDEAMILHLGRLIESAKKTNNRRSSL